MMLRTGQFAPIRANMLFSLGICSIIFCLLGGSAIAQTCTISGTGTKLWNPTTSPTCVESGVTTATATTIVIPAGVTLNFDDNGDTWTGSYVLVYGTLGITAPGQVTINASVYAYSGGLISISSKLNLGSATGCGYTLSGETGSTIDIVGSTPDRLEICGKEIARGGTAGCNTYPAGPTPYCEPSGGFPTPLTFTQNGAGPLPVELIFFKAYSQGNSVLLKWATATERDADYFAIERSTDGKVYKQVGTVRASGNSVFRQDYSFEDKGVLLGRSYYRLKEVDFDGRYEYFNVTFADTDGKRAISVHPNPLKDSRLDLYLNWASDDQVSGKIYNASGAVVNTFSFLGSSYSAETNLRSGTYLLKVQSGKDVFTTRFVVP